MNETQEFKKRIGRIDALIQKLESIADPALRATAKELVQSLMELHGAGIERMLEIVSEAGPAGSSIIASMGRDELVTSLLVLYDLHPDNFETRVHRALEKVRPVLRLEGARIEVIAIAEGSVHLQIRGAPATDVRAAVREALFETAPDASDVVIEGGHERAASSSFVPLAVLTAPNGRP
jgi:Fe-S cluster biogenesis protein NfuA